MSMKFPVTPSGIEPASFRLVAQCLKRLHHQEACRRYSVNDKQLFIIDRAVCLIKNCVFHRLRGIWVALTFQSLLVRLRDAPPV